MSEKENKPLNNMDDLLNRLGIFRRFHFTTFFGLELMFSALAFSMIQMVYAGKTPDWHCSFRAHQNVFRNVSIEDQEKASHYVTDLMTLIDAAPNNQTFKVCSINGTKCDAFTFTNLSRTVVSEWSLVCDKAWIKKLMISIQMAGALLGTLLSGHLGDYFGRRNILYAFLLMCSVVNFIAGFSVSWEMFTACRLFVGISFGIAAVTAYPYHIEISPQRWRSILAGFPAFATGLTLFAGFAFVLEDWSKLHFTAAAIIAPFLLGWFFFPESPRWLAVHNKLHEAEKAVEKIARVNRKPVPPGTVALLTKIANEEKEKRKTGRMYSFFDLFSTFQITKLSLAGACMCCAIGALDYGITFGISNLHGNMFLNMFLMEVLQLPLQLTMIYAVNKFGRRLSALFCFLISAGCLIVLFCAQESFRGAIISGLSLTVRITMRLAFNVVALLCLEVFPTVMRNLGYSFVMVSFRVGSIIAPFIINFEQEAVVPYGIMTALLVLCNLLTLIMPETKGVPLADSTTRTVKIVPQNDLHLEEDSGDHESSSSKNVKA